MNKQQQQFIELIHKNEKIIFKVLAVYANGAWDQKDLHQEILLQLWKAFPSFKGTSKVSTWIYRIALNTVVTQFRRNKNVIPKTELNDAVLQIADVPHYDIEELMRKLHQQINQLNELDKALVLLYLENKNYEEMAEITGLSVTNVGSRLSRIKQRMRKKVKTN